MSREDDISSTELAEARKRLEPYIARTPLVRGQAGLDAWLKLETQQPTGSFKVRPAFNGMIARQDEARARGIVASSSGNFAQAVAYAAARLGLRARIVMPSNTSPYKIERTRVFGGEVVLSGPSFDERWALTEKLQRESNALLVHPYDTRETIVGDATIGAELLEDLQGDLTVIVPASGGGMLAGIATAVKHARPGARVIGVQSKANGSMLASFKSGSRVKVAPFTTIADALVAMIPGEHTFDLIKKYVDDVVVVDEDEIREAVRFLAVEQKLVAEPGGATAVAAVRAGRVSRGKGELACIVSGGNIEPKQLAALLG